MKAVVLLSGGMDSAVTLAWMKRSGHACTALSFDYGQRHRVELAAAASVARAMGAVEHRVQHIDLRAFGHSALTDDIAVPKDRADMASGPVPVTYVPARNTVFLSMALALAESIDARDIAIGANAIDYSGYPDCRPQFLESFERLANLGTKAGVEAAACAPGSRPFRIHAPLLRMTKAQIVHKGIELGVDFGLTSSCYDPSVAGEACGHCDACILRAKGFAEAGVVDPRG